MGIRRFFVGSLLWGWGADGMDDWMWSSEIMKASARLLDIGCGSTGHSM